MTRSKRTFAVATNFAFLLVCASPACAVRLTDKNSPADNGAVTGAPVDCLQITPVGTGAPGTAAALKLVGRYDMTDPAGAKFDWSGNYITASFNGTEVSAGIEVPEGQDNDFVFTAVVDDLPPINFRVTPQQKSYLIASGLPAGDHEVVVMRNSEALNGTTIYTGFNFGADGVPLPPTERPRRIEFIGDAITCGYGILGTNASCPDDIEIRAATENIYLAYGSQTARTLSADVVTTCFSGKGVVFNYQEKPNDLDATTTIPQYYERTIATQADPPWSFAEPEPDVVVISAGTSDFMRDVNMDGIADGIDLDAFHDGYLAFVKSVRSRRPNAHIFMAVSPMLTDEFPLTNSRRDMRDVLGRIASEMADSGDMKVYRIEFVEMGDRYGYGCEYYPNLDVHRIMANQLVGAIRQKTCW
ncbi:MAG: GDSL-type esterase/lipase family protein [Polyangiaceae bacterium]|nr:GDSL-type esterase/lipase family protein [Polyangiaceae bacterium]